MPRKKKGKEEIKVPPPPYKPRKEALLKDTTWIEEHRVFKASTKIGKRLSILMIVVGALLSLFSLYAILISTWLLFSNPLFIGALGFLGVINIVCGLILLSKEYPL
jgi:uncharacterized membrane protein